jgi:xanthine dehydrogenase accessory factor
MQVWLERWSGEAAIALTEQILSKLQSGQGITLVTPLEQNNSPYLSENPNNISITPNNIKNPFIEYLQPPPTLLIIGAGHVGEQLAKVSHVIGFEVAIQGDRPEWANMSKYPQAHWILTDAIASVLDKFANHSQLYVALVTRGYAYDLEALAALLKRKINCRYIGMIGSEKRVKKVYQSLLKSGLTSDQFAPIYAPIGLDIEALTPEEIAISICAELIMVRRGGTGLPLSTHLRQMFTSPTLLSVSDRICFDDSPDRGK